MRLPSPVSPRIAPSAGGSAGCSFRSVGLLGRCVVSGSVVLLGSRWLPAAGLSLCARVGRSVAVSGLPVSVGCASGADLAFVAGVLAGGGAGALSVFAVGGPVPALAAAVGAGVPVRWWAGGGAGVPVRARLAARSSACVASVPSGFAFGVVSSPGSRGSFRSLRLAAAAGLVCSVVPVGFPASRLPALAGGGAWVAARWSGGPCWRWLAR